MPELLTARWEIRSAMLADLDWILQELQAFSAFFQSKRSLLENEEVARTRLAWLIQHHIMRICEQEGQPVGFIGGLLDGHPMNADITVLTEVFWWVTESARRSRAGLLLLEDFITIGRAHADWIILALEHQSPIREETLTRRGFRCKERSYILEV